MPTQLHLKAEEGIDSCGFEDNTINAILLIEDCFEIELNLVDKSAGF